MTVVFKIMLEVQTLVCNFQIFVCRLIVHLVAIVNSTLGSGKCTFDTSMLGGINRTRMLSNILT